MPRPCFFFVEHTARTDCARVLYHRFFFGVRSHPATRHEGFTHCRYYCCSARLSYRRCLTIVYRWLTNYLLAFYLIHFIVQVVPLCVSSIILLRCQKWRLKIDCANNGCPTNLRTDNTITEGPRLLEKLALRGYPKVEIPIYRNNRELYFVWRACVEINFQEFAWKG